MDFKELAALVNLLSLFFSYRELAFFYPDFVAPTIVQRRKKKRLQRTLALIRPDALKTRKGIHQQLPNENLVTYHIVQSMHVQSLN